ncbi:Alpha/Beta hydrolase protein [Gymnopilus junonius]|uniref:Alpha/Beta hydrolase protein n=1 Tax=Gymnopilus junonius TaxID=109634 RepID=A0A9P5NIE7_GYMJU|nr:Alpha/Beta hydrolase protein [Gymnopilus junonius]
MSGNLIRSTTTRRGFVYSYHYNAPSTDKPTIIFLHGFPSTHSDWASQISFFSGKGYGVIAPDLLGYGGTSAPDDVSQYRLLDMVEDVIDIFKDLGVVKVIGVAHDWGSILLSRLLNTHSDRFLGAAFLAVGYVAPQADYDYDTQLAVFNKLVGYDVWGYWKFFADSSAPALIEKHIDSFYSLAFPNDPLIWKDDLAPIGKAKEWIEQNKQLPRADFWTHEQKEEHKKALFKKGLRGPCNWYAAFLAKTNKADEASIATEAHHISIPTFYGAALKDYVCLAQLTKPTMGALCSNVTTKDFDTSHWIMLEASDELNDALEQFFRSL